jgi:hypothetical protein
VTAVKATTRRVDVLPDREAETLATLLQAHPGVRIICRDRAGDAAAGGRRKVRRIPRVMTADAAAARDSVVRLAEARFDVAVFGHGPAVRSRAVDRFKELAAA